jgi:hypothetical protein
LIAGSLSGIWRSVDHGTTWLLTDTITAFDRLLPMGRIDFIASEGDLVVTNSENYGLYLSTDLGRSWKFIYPPEVQVGSVQIDGGTIFIATFGGVQCSGDDAQTWTYDLSGIGGEFFPLPIVANQGPTLLAVSVSGVFISHNTGSSWFQANAGLTDTFIISGAIGGSNYYIEDSSGAVYIANKATSSVGIMKHQFSFSIAPNPVENFALIRYSLSTPSEVTLSISDLLGRTEKLMVNDWQSSELHDFSIDTRNLNPGIYECFLEYNGTETSQKIVVLK